MRQQKTHLVGQLQRPKGRPENVELIVESRPNITDSEAKASIEAVDATYSEGYIERHFGKADGTTDSTVPLETAATVGRGNVYFARAENTDTLSEYSHFYIVRDAYIQRSNLIGPANLTSNGTQTDSVLRLGRDGLNGNQWRYKVIQDITFSGVLRADNGVTFGSDDDEPNNLTSGWSFIRCLWERCNKSIWKQFGNLGNSYYDCSGSNGNFGYWAEGYPKRTTLSGAEATGQTTLSVANVTGINVNDIVRVEMDDGTEHQSTVNSIDIANSTITIADGTDDDAASGNYVKIYHSDFSIPVSLQHTGADRWYGGEWNGFRKAAFYIDGQQAPGNGGTLIDGVIIEDNPGFGIFIKDYNNSFNTMHLRNVWFESNGSDGPGYPLDADGIALSQTPGGAGNFTLNGTLCSGGTFTADTTNARQLSFTSDADESGDTYTITGTDVFGNAQTENVTGPNTTTVNSVNAYLTVTQISTNGAGTGNITIGVTGAVDLEDREGPREPRDLYLENVDHCIVEGSQLRKIEIIDSYVEFDRCKVDNDNTEFHVNDSVGGSRIKMTNIQVVGFGDSVTGASDVVIDSITGPLREIGSTMRQWIAPPRNKHITTPPGSGVLRGGCSGERGQYLQDTVASDDKAPTIVAGHTFPQASQYSLTGGGDWQVAEALSGASVSANSYIVATQEIKLDSGSINKLQYIGSATWTRNTGYDLLTSGEWQTLAWVGKTGDDSGTMRLSVGTAAATTATITLGAGQIVEFSTEGEAIEYYNNRYLCTEYATLQAAEDTRYKLADENVASSTTLQDDDHLKGWTLDANKYYKITGHLRETHNVGDIKIMFNFTNTPQVFSLSAIGVEPGAATLVGEQEESDSTAISITTLTDSVENSIELSGYFQANASTGGTVDFQWAQNGSSANNTTLREGSWISIQLIGTDLQ